MILISLILALAGAAGDARADDRPVQLHVITADLLEADARALVAKTADLPEDILHPANLDTFLTGFPFSLVSGGQASRLITCPRGAIRTTRADIGQLADRIEAQVTNLSIREASETVRTLDQALACLKEAVDPADLQAAARAYFWRGVLASNLSPPAEKERQTAYQQTLALYPRMPWDESHLVDARDGRQAFDEAIGSAGHPRMRELAVIPTGAPLWIDGYKASVAITLNIAAGWHFLQFRGANGVVESCWVYFDPDPPPSGPVLEGVHRPALVVAGAITSDALEWVSDPGQRLGLAQLLAARLGEGETVYVVTREHKVWRGVTGAEAWTQIHRRHPVAQAVSTVGAITAIAGGSTAVAGIATYGIGCRVAYVDSGKRGGPCGYKQARGSGAMAAGWPMFTLGLITGGGGGLLFLGAQLDLKLNLSASPGASGAQLTVTRALGPGGVR